MRQNIGEPEIVKEYFKYYKVKNAALKSKVVDLSYHSWVYPTFLAPLWNLFMHNDFEYRPPRNPKVDSYIDTIFSIEYSKGSTYLPLQCLPLNPKNLGQVFDNLQNWSGNGKSYGGANAFNFILTELIDNIYEHSEFNNACVLAQCYPNKRFAEISVFDDGISIPRSFENWGISFKSDSDAIYKAINGFSTKDDGRGRGLSSTIDMYVNGGGAEVLGVSRNGILYKKKSEPAKLYNTELMNTTNYILNSEYIPFEGTLFSVRLPYPSPNINAHYYY